MNNNVREFKRVIAITLCFCLIVLSNSRIQVDAKTDHKSFTKKFEKYLKKNKKEIDISADNDFIEAHYGNNTSIFIDLEKNKKKTNRDYMRTIGSGASNYIFYNNHTITTINANTVFITENSYKGPFFCTVLKKNPQKCRIIDVTKGYSHKPKAKKMKRIKKSLMKIVRIIDSL